MNAAELFLILLVAVVIVAGLAQRVRLPYPIALVLSGLGLAFVPGLPEFQLDPHVVFLIFLPPILMQAAYFTSLRDFRANLRPILLLAIGLVIVTSTAVAYSMTLLVPGLTLAMGFVLGGIVSPPDAVAATAITKQLHVPRRINTVLEGESLINDASGLIVYKFAVLAVATGYFSFAEAGVHFIWAAIAGTLVGLGIGHGFMRLVGHIKENAIATTSTFLVSYAAYILAEWIQGSGILAVVAAGLVVGWKAPEKFSADLRIKATAVWHMVIFLLEGFIFILIGLQFPSVLSRLDIYENSELMRYAAIICAVVIGVRLAWVFVVGYGSRFVFPSIRRHDPYPEWQSVFIVGWAGIRGVITVATALALPLFTQDGSAFPHRDLIIFLAFCVVLATLVMQGMTLPFFARNLRLTFDSLVAQEEWAARRKAVDGALSKLCEWERDGHYPIPLLQRLRSHYADKLEALGDGPNTRLPWARDAKTLRQATQHNLEKKLWYQVIEVERSAIIHMRKTYQIGDEALHAIQRELDLLAARYKIQE